METDSLKPLPQGLYEEAKAIAEQRAREHLIDFCILTNRNYSPNWHHDIIGLKLEEIENGDFRKRGKQILMLFLPPRTGKALEINTEIPTPSGWKKIKDFVVGDELFDEKGKICHIVAKSEIFKNRKVFKVVADDNCDIIADAEHEWFVRLDRKSKKFSIKNTQFLFNRNCPRKAMLPKKYPIRTKKIKLAIDPYVLGVWLGDGTSKQAIITQGDNDIEFVREKFEKRGQKTTNQKTRCTFGTLGLKVKLRELGVLGNKHIPEIYLRSSIKQRIDLLQGLIDTDGYVDERDGQVEFCNVNFELAKQVQELVKSLGIKCFLNVGNATLNGKFISKKYRVIFYFLKAASLPRKKRYCRNAGRTCNNYIKIEKIDNLADTVCIQVDSVSHLFLAGRSFLPTHNSELATVNFPAWYLGRKPDKEVITVSYSGELAQDFGKKTREIISDIPFQNIFGITLKEDEKGAAKWRTEKGGSYTSIGLGGAITGRGADILILDDLIKNREEANSEVYRDKVWSFFISTAYTRLEPNGVVIIILTRWHYDDIAGRILSEPEFKDKVEVIEFPALAEKDEKYRKQGDALWPERYGREYYESLKRLDIYEFSALYQQKPIISEAQEFKQEYFRYFEDNEIDTKPLNINILIDPAISKKDTACDTGLIDVAKIKDKADWYVLDDSSAKIDPGSLIEKVFNKVDFYKKSYDCTVNVWIETVAYQEALAYWFKEKMREKEIYFTINEIKTKSDKEQRIRGLIPLYKQGIIKHRPSMKGGKLEQQAIYFPFGKLVDSLDALSFNLQATLPTKPKRYNVSVSDTSDSLTGY